MLTGIKIRANSDIFKLLIHQPDIFWGNFSASEEIKDLISSMLQKEGKRITMNGVMDHAWFDKEGVLKEEVEKVMGCIF